MNPFDDSSSPKTNPLHYPGVKLGGGRSTNPFVNDISDDIYTTSDNSIKKNQPSSGAIVRSTLSDLNDEVLDHVEAAWQDLGELPYRRVRLYTNVSWGSIKARRNESLQLQADNQSGNRQESKYNDERFGLSWYPKPFVDNVRAHKSAVLGEAGDLKRLLSTTTTTLVGGCPNGGPLAAVTLPLSTLGGAQSVGAGFGLKTTIRIMNNAGVILATIPFPPRDLSVMTSQSKFIQLHRSPGDILTIGFTSRCILIIVLRDSLTLCYDLAGKRVLPPFFALTAGHSSGAKDQFASQGGDLLEACVFEGGVAVLGADMNAAVVELLDEHDDPIYADTADLTSRRIVPLVQMNRETMSQGADSATPFSASPPPHYALITPLPTAIFARSKHYSFGCIAVLSRQYAPSRRPELFLSTSDGSIVVSELHPSTSPNNGLNDVDCRTKIGGQSAQIVSMAFAPNGRFLACFTSNSMLTVVSTTFESIVLEFDTSSGSSSPPRSMGWCGEDSVVMYFKNLGVLMVGPYGDWLRFGYGQDDFAGHGDADTNLPLMRHGNDSVYLVPEIDCCRVVTSSSVDILQRVPPVTADLLRVGSIEPGALLLDASDAFDSGSPNADDAARSITQQDGLLEDAIRDCITAAVGEFDIKVQKRMLRAASYGLHFACKDEHSYSRATGRPSPEAVVFVNAARKLRVLNVCRKPSTGFAMTSAQYDAVMPKGLVARLIASGNSTLASSIAEYLKLGRQVCDFTRAMKAVSFINSVSSMSSTNQSDAQVAEEAIQIIRGERKMDVNLSKMYKHSSMSEPSSGMYASVALAAHRAGRRGVADLLIVLEQSSTDKVNTLLAIGSHADAAAVAAKTRDSDLIFKALSAYFFGFQDTDEGKNSYYSGVVNKFPIEAINMLTTYHSRIAILGGDVKPMVNILTRRQKHLEAGSKMAKRAVALGQSSATSTMTENERENQRIETLKEASNIFGLAGKDCIFQKTCTDEYLDLLSDQDQLRKQYGSMDVAPQSSSITSTIMAILKFAAKDPRSAHRLFADADKLAKKYKVSEKRLWYVKLRAFSESGQWAVLRNFAESRNKSPIGMKPFALAAIKGKQGEAEIMHYMSRMQGQSDGEDRYELFCEARMWLKAVDEAIKLGDKRKISNVRSMCNSPEIQSLCDKYL